MSEPTTHTPSPVVYIDVETDGLHPERRVWEVAMIRREPDGRERERHMYVGIDLRTADPYALKLGGFWDRHPTGRKLSGKLQTPADLAAVVYSKHDAARVVMEMTFGAHLVGVNPAFDASTLEMLLRREGFVPAWHYHLVDLIPMAVGYLNAVARYARPVIALPSGGAEPTEAEWREILEPLHMWQLPADMVIHTDAGAPDLRPPWKSDELSRACGVEPPPKGARHTAMGDARWALRWHDALTGVAVGGARS